MLQKLKDFGANYLQIIRRTIMFGTTPTNFPKNINAAEKKKTGKWKRKTESEIHEIQKKIKKSAYNLSMPLGILSILFLIVYVAKDFIDQDYRVYCYFLPVLSFIITFLFQIANGRSFGNSPRIKICNRCLKEDWLKLNRCPCGGVLEPPEYYDFIETGK
jgi:hypothetical protein